MESRTRVPAVVAAGDGRASRAVYGKDKAYLELGGRPLVARIVGMLQRVPEISEVFVVGREEKLARVLDTPEVREGLRKPLTIVPQFRNLLENGWETYRRTLPGAGAAGRDPVDEAERDLQVLYLATDLPFLTPQEVSEFVQRSLALPDCDYALGLVSESSLEPFYPEAPGEPGIHMAYFNAAEGRFRQNNLHLVRPARLGHRERIQDMYEHRYQQNLWNAASLAWKIATNEGGGFWMIWYYLRMHLAGVADRHGFRRIADRLRSSVTFERLERACGKLLGTRYRFVVTQVGGSAVDIDNETDFDAAVACFERWSEGQAAAAEALHGPLPLPERADAPLALERLTRNRS